MAEETRGRGEFGRGGYQKRQPQWRDRDGERSARGERGGFQIAVVASATTVVMASAAVSSVVTTTAVILVRVMIVVGTAVATSVATTAAAASRIADAGVHLVTTAVTRTTPRRMSTSRPTVMSRRFRPASALRSSTAMLCAL